MTASPLSQRIFDRLAAETADPPGITRASYGAGEQIAHDICRAEAETLDCAVETDAAGNLLITWSGRDPSLPRIVTGSHLDSVPHGGNYDGAAGVVAGLAAVAELRDAGATLERDLTVVAFRGEEAAWFPLSYIGSHAALGRMPTDYLDARRSDTGRTLAAHMAEAGFDPEAVRRGETLLSPDAIELFLETHIEQGPVLINTDVPVGIVSGIFGGFRHINGCIAGEWAHSGATPRGHRRDAALAFGDLTAGVEAVWDGLDRDGLETVITFGIIETDAAFHGGSRVAGALRFSLDVRSGSVEALDRVSAELPPLLADIETRRGVSIALGARFDWPVAGMSSDVREKLARAASVAGVPAVDLPSGAGHDAAVFAETGIPTAMLFVRNAHGSHNPDEAMAMEDLDRAVEVMSRFLIDHYGS